MSIRDYQQSTDIEFVSWEQGWSFYALLMTCIRRADSDNLEALREAFPEVYAELHARYKAPGGILTEKQEAA